MKNYTLFLCSVLCVFLFSCNKSNEPEIPKIPENQTITSSPKFLFIHGTTHIVWHRPISERPRDGEPCNCEMCFGICAETDVSVTYHSFVPPSNPPQLGDPIQTFVSETQGDKMKIYVLENISWSENSIVIDNAVDFRMDSLLNLSIPGAELLTGEYPFYSESGFIKFNGEKIPYFGYFTGDIKHL